MSQSQPMANGETSFKTIDHITSYPVISDGINIYKANTYGAKSLDLTQQTFDTVVAPLIPYAKRPYGYVAPFVEKADSLTSSTLMRVDETFPIITKQPEEIKDTILDYAYLPLRLTNDTKNYVLNTYSQEYKKCGGDGMVSGTKAILTTSMVVTSDYLAWLSAFLSQKKDQGQSFAEKKYSQGQGFAHRANDYANEKADQARNLAYQKAEDGKEKAKQAKQTAEDKSKK